MAANKETLKTIYFEDLSVMEILSYFGKQFCEQRLEYVHFGRDLRKAWEVLSNNEQHYDVICDELCLATDTAKELMAVAKALHKHLDETQVSAAKVAETLEAHIPISWFKFDKLTPEKNDAQFKMFMNSLFGHLRTQFVLNDKVWKMKLARRVRLPRKKR